LAGFIGVPFGVLTDNPIWAGAITGGLTQGLNDLVLKDDFNFRNAVIAATIGGSLTGLAPNIVRPLNNDALEHIANNAWSNGTNQLLNNYANIGNIISAGKTPKKEDL
jgi:hypothetical protein